MLFVLVSKFSMKINLIWAENTVILNSVFSKWKNNFCTPLHCWQRHLCWFTILLPLVYNKTMMVLLSLVFWNQRFGGWVLKMFYFQSNYVMRGQLFLLYHVFGTYSFPISFFLVNLLTSWIYFTLKKYSGELENWGKDSKILLTRFFFPNSFGKERNEEDKMLGIWEYFCFVHW